MNLSEAFKEWVANQPAEQEINHGSWKSCACGEFAGSLNDPDIISYDVADSVRNAHGHNAYMILGNGGTDFFGKQLVDISTYGKLSVWLNSLI
ncbi:hypothetical protein [Pseudomonas phage Astolliot]|nr:hypothetical protein [Pseudomonas phage Astolliot]